MFYQTQVKSIIQGGVIDTNGKQLSLIGNKLVKQGDFVWTDGKVVFGHTPIRGGGILHAEQGGIPVLANNLRGYFNINGDFKSYNIAGEAWIVNNKNFFAHDVHDTNIIDADFASDGDTFTVTDGFYRKCHAVKFNNHLFCVHHSTEDGLPTQHTIKYYTEPFVGEEITLGADADDIDTPITIYKNGVIFDQIHLEKFTRPAIEACYDRRDILLSKSDNITSNTNLVQQPSPPANWIQKPAPPDSFIALSYARVETFNIKPNGDWDAIIFAAAYGYCFPYRVLSGSVFGPIFGYSVNAPKTFCSSLVVGLDALEYAIFEKNYFPFLHITKYPDFTGQEKVNGAYTSEYKQYIEDKLQYYIPIVRFKHYSWITAIFHASTFLLVHNGEIVTVMSSHKDGGNDYWITGGADWDENQVFNANSIPNITAYKDGITSNVTISNDWSFPLGDNFFIVGKGASANSLLFNNEKVADIYNLLYFDRIYLSFGFGIGSNYTLPLRYRTDEVAKSLANQFQQDISFIWGNQIQIFYLTDEEAYIKRYLKADDKEIYYPIGICLSKTSSDGFFRFSLSATQLANKKFLFGFHNGALYLIDSKGSIEQINDGLKNFRFRELKRISKAKK